MPSPPQSRPHESREPSLLIRFGLISLAVIGALGLVVGNQLHAVISARAQENARDASEVYLQLVKSRFLSPDRATSPGSVATPAQISLSEQIIQEPVIQEQVLSATAWLLDGTVAFSTDQAAIGSREELPGSARAALGGGTASELAGPDRVRSDGWDLAQHAGEQVMVVDMPLSLVGDERPEAVIELTTTYAETAEAIDRDTTVMLAWLAGGLLVLWLALFRLVASASRTMRQQSQANRVLALHDSLTGLANRSLLRERTTQAIKAASRREGHVALLLLDLDRFKEINDTLGHHHGDLLLTMIGPRLQAVLREEDTIARLGGDEFVVLLPAVSGATDAQEVAQRVLAALDEPFMVDGVELDVGSSLGIAVFPEHGEDVETLMRHADVAMYAAKDQQVGAAVYDAGQDANSPARLALLGELRRGIETDQLLLHYQPKVDIASGVVTGVEALVRWRHPVHGMLAPDAFIPLAERTGLIRPLTTLVLDRALAQVAAWDADGRDLTVAVNLSARCLLDLDLHDEVVAALARHQVAGDRLWLEITESTVMVEPDRALRMLQSLADLGIGLSIDDFGTGYSSLAYLQRLPVHELKIDRSFVADLGSDTNTVIVSASIDLARNLGLSAIAEGVEDQRTWDRLAELGCHAAQGYLLSRPLPADELDSWLDQRVPSPAPAA